MLPVAESERVCIKASARFCLQESSTGELVEVSCATSAKCLLEQPTRDQSQLWPGICSPVPERVGREVFVRGTRRTGVACYLVRHYPMFLLASTCCETFVGNVEEIIEVFLRYNSVLARILGKYKKPIFKTMF